MKALDQAVPGGCKWRTRNFGAARGEILRPRRASTMLRRRSGVRWSGLSLLGRYPQTGPRAPQTSRAAEDSVHEGRRHELQRARGEDKRAAHRRQVHRRAHRRRVAEGHVAERVVDAEAAVGVDAAEPVHVRVLDRACWWQAESPLLWGGLRRAPAGAASPPPAQAALRLRRRVAAVRGDATAPRQRAPRLLARRPPPARLSFGAACCRRRREGGSNARR